ncbi:uncharacterized protein LOC107607898 [Arachis ipaensis]|uniref:uncharacterized protein LOC107607898 n=1 Tax=Arachis ipaensis TaxID=130454 RepID=UPI0007AF1141|nr:uncharacterized protein LOC107607898 [Arachis ipaensis]XP_025665282.1 uncharacterized protein LOC112763967 [Arachis hypogaea]
MPKFDTYTPLNTRRKDIIKEILNAKIIKPPSRAGSYQEQRYVDKSKHCAFHQKFGHMTDECVIAKDLLERLAREGHLDKYIGKKTQQHPKITAEHPTEHQPSTAEKNRSQPPTTRGVIHCISGGSAGGGNTNSARKRSYRTMLMVQSADDAPAIKSHVNTISFERSDLRAKATNLDDPVVILIQAGDLLVKKVLLDPGSSADVLFFSTFQKMKLSANTMIPSSGELVGFSGE